MWKYATGRAVLTCAAVLVLPGWGGHLHSGGATERDVCRSHWPDATCSHTDALDLQASARHSLQLGRADAPPLCPHPSGLLTPLQGPLDHSGSFAGPLTPLRPGPPLPPSVTSSLGGDALTVTAEEGADLPREQRVAVLQRALTMTEQYKRSRDKLLREVNLQSADLERAQTQSSVLTTSLQARPPPALRSYSSAPPHPACH